MQIRNVMSTQIVSIGPEESVAIAARLLLHYNIGILPICNAEHRLRGIITDRDIVLRCIAAGKNPTQTQVCQIMSTHIISVSPDCSTDNAAILMGREQVRRLPVCEDGKLVGLVSLSDLPLRNIEASTTLSYICQGVHRR